MFVDQAKIYVKAGDGGDGCLAFRREKYVPRGGPSGGNGGKGGDVYFRSTEHLNTLQGFKFQQHFTAGRGAHGSGSKRQGKDGADLYVDVPIGTQVYDADSERLIADFGAAGQVHKLAQGGRGGRGNAAFATSTNQAPRRVEEGLPGESFTLRLELKVLADVGLIGFPNAGKSTLISTISGARPKVADYPFTTLTPHLGVVTYDQYRSFVVADIPGLIEGAHAGSGLGDQFLRHIERCRILLHLIDVSALGPEDPAAAWKTVERELRLYGSGLEKKPQVVAAAKLDSADPDRVKQLAAFCRRSGLPYFQISAVTGEGVPELKRAIVDKLAEVASEVVP